MSAPGAELPRPGGPVAVTGAGGFIGVPLCARLAERGIEVVGLDVDERARARIATAGAGFRRCDVTDADEVAAALDGCARVVHAAARVSDWGLHEEFERLNVGGTRNVLRAAERAGFERVVHISTVAIWSYREPGFIAEDHPPTPSPIPYAETKAAADLEAQDHGATIVRPGDAYGPGPSPWTLRAFRTVRSRRLVLPGGGQGLMTLVYVDDLVDCIERALLHSGAAGQAFTAWDGRPVTAREFFGRYARMLGRRGVPAAPAPLLRAVAAIDEGVAQLRGREPSVTRTALLQVSRRATFSNERARRVLGWEPRVDLEEGMRRIEAWLREQGELP